MGNDGVIDLEEEIKRRVREKLELVIVQLERKPNLIKLKLVKTDSERAGCNHLHIEVDELKNEVSCEDCGEILNPIGLLSRMAEQESLWAVSAKRMRYERDCLAEAREKRRCKCQHCGRITPVGR